MGKDLISDQSNQDTENNGTQLTRRNALKNMMWMPLAGYAVITPALSLAGDPSVNNKNDLSVLNGFVSGKPDNWYKYCRPILEWLNPHKNLNVVEYVDELIAMAKKMNVDTIYHLIDFGGAPLFNGSIEPKSKFIGDYDLLEILEKRIHQEGMYFVGAQFGSHTQSSIALRHPDWLARRINNDPIYGPGGVPLICFNSEYCDYVGDELSLIVQKYKTDGLYIEGLHTTNCFCESCKKTHQKLYNKPIPDNLPQGHIELQRFRMDSVINFIDSINKKVKKHSPETVVMACPSANNGENGRVDWKKLGEVCDVTSLERMWGYGFIYPIWKQGMSLGVMMAESKRNSFTTAWYSQHVDREYTPRSKETIAINYLEAIINGGTSQFHTQNGPDEVPDNIPELNKLYSYTEKIRPYFFHADKINPVALLYDRDWYYPEPHFCGYYKSLVYNHIPFKIISRDEISSDFLKSVKVLVLPNVIRISGEEEKNIRRFVENGGVLIATYKTGFQSEKSKTSCFADLFGINAYKREKKTAGKPPAGKNLWTPEYYRTDWNFYYRCKKGSYADIASQYSLLTYRGGVLTIDTNNDVNVLANIVEIDKSRQDELHPVYGFYPGETGSPLMLERKHRKGKVIYFAGELDEDFEKNGNDFVGNLLASAVLQEDLPVFTKAPSTVEVTYFEDKSNNVLLVHLLNMTTNQRLYPDSVNEIFPVYGINLKIKGGKRATCLNGSDLKTNKKNGFLNVDIHELKVIESLVVEW